MKLFLKKKNIKSLSEDKLNRLQPLNAKYTNAINGGASATSPTVTSLEVAITITLIPITQGH